MPEIKNNFLKGKMNKDLDDRLLPEGEYRDAQNIQISKSEGSNTGVVQNVTGNAKAHTALGLSASNQVIGHTVDEKNEYVIFFITDNTTHSIRLYDNFDNQVHILCSGSFLGFSKTNLITGINLVEDLLFWTDYKNQPRKLNVKKALADSSYYDNEDLISVAKYSPYKAATIDMSNESSIKGDYIKEKFVRFSYRYKFEDNEFSTLAPFTQIAFELASQTLTDAQISKAATSTFLQEMVNNANQVLVTVPLPTNPNTDYGIKAVEVIIKDSNSAVAKIVDTIELGSADTADNKSFNDSDTSARYKYKSTVPVKTLPEDQIIRVFDDVPLTAKAQEVSGNRIIYGNFSKNITFDSNGDINEDGTHPVVDYSVAVKDRSTANSDSADSEYPHHSLKQRREYEVGIVLSDKWGRKSPVILSDSSSVYFEAKDDDFDSNDWLGSCLAVTFNTAIPNAYDATTNPHGWYSWRVVVKQTEQDYYNVYGPGVMKLVHDGYLSLHGDNVNKITRSGEENSETELSPSKTRLYPKLINTSTYSKILTDSFRPTVQKDATIKAQRYTVKNTNSSASTDGVLDIVHPFNFHGEVGAATPGTNSYVKITTSNAIINTTATSAGIFVFNGIKEIGTFSAIASPHTKVTAALLYVNGVYQKETSITSSSASIGGTGNGNATIQVTFGSALTAGDKVDIILVYKSNVGAGVNSIVDSLVDPRNGDTANIELGDATEIPDNVISPKFALLRSSTFETLLDLAKANYTVTPKDHIQSNGGLMEVSGIGGVNIFGDFTDEIKGGEGVGLYDSKNNPLMARLSDNVTPGDNTDFVSFLSGVNELSVFETKPTESVLDIYYETSTSGLVTELNTEINAAALTTFDCSDASFSISDGTTGNTIVSSDYSVSAGTVTAVSPTTYSSSSATYTATITVPSGYSNSGQSITCTDTATGTTQQTAFTCSNAGFSVSNGQTGANISKSVSAGTIVSVSPSTYTAGSATYTATITVPSGYTNSGQNITCTDTATGSAIAFTCSHAGLSVPNGTTGASVTGTVSQGTMEGSFNPSTYQSGTVSYSRTIRVPNNSSLWTNANDTILCSDTATSTVSSGISVSPTSLSYGSNVQAQSFTVTQSGSGNVTISGVPSWLSLNPSSISSTYNSGISATVQSNSTSAPRSATITLTKAGVGSATVSVTQAAASETLVLGSLTQFASTSASSQSLSLTQSGSSVPSVTSKPSWVTISPSSLTTSTSSLTVSVSDHTASGVRSGTIQVTKGSVVDTANVAQAGAQAATTASVTPTTFVINQGQSSTHSFNLTANGLWQITVAGSNPPYTVSPSSGSGNYNGIVITYNGTSGLSKDGKIHVNPPLDANTQLATVTMDIGQ